MPREACCCRLSSCLRSSRICPFRLCSYECFPPITLCRGDYALSLSTGGAMHCVTSFAMLITILRRLCLASPCAAGGSNDFKAN